MKLPSVKDLKTITGKGVKSAAEDAVAKTGGVLRLAPCWVPRSFMQPEHVTVNLSNISRKLAAGRYLVSTRLIFR